MPAAFGVLLGQGSPSDLGTVTVGTAVPVGGFVVASMMSTAGVVGITDSRGNTYSLLKDIGGAGGSNTVRIWGAYITTALQVGDTLTFDFTGATTSRVLVYSLTGIRELSPLDVTAQNNGTGSPWTSGTTGATTFEDAIALIGFSHSANNTVAVTSPYTKIGQATGSTFNHTAAFKVLTATGAQSGGGTIPTSVSWGAAIVVLKGIPYVPQVLLL